MAASLAGALAVITPGTFQQPQAAQFPHNLGTANTPLLDLVKDRLDSGGGGGGDRGGADRGGGGDRGMRSGGGETRSFRGDGGGRGDRSMSRESNRSREFRSENRGGDRDHSARRNRGDGG